MNRLADLIEAEERIERMNGLIRRQEAVMLRLRQLGATPSLMQVAERLHRVMTSNLLAALAHRDGLAATLDKYSPGGALSAMQMGLRAPIWTIEDLSEGV